MLSTNLMASSTVGFVTIISATLYCDVPFHPHTSNILPFLFLATVPTTWPGLRNLALRRLPSSIGRAIHHLSQNKKSSPPGGHAIRDCCDLVIFLDQGPAVQHIWVVLPWLQCTEILLTHTHDTQAVLAGLSVCIS